MRKIIALLAVTFLTGYSAYYTAEPTEGSSDPRKRIDIPECFTISEVFDDFTKKENVVGLYCLQEEQE